jgi:hypothetical protein
VARPMRPMYVILYCYPPRVSLIKESETLTWYQARFSLFPPSPPQPPAGRRAPLPWLATLLHPPPTSTASHLFPPLPGRRSQPLPPIQALPTLPAVVCPPLHLRGGGGTRSSLEAVRWGPRPTVRWRLRLVWPRPAASAHPCILRLEASARTAPCRT